MLVILITFVLVLGIAFYQAVQGMFSSIIMALLTIACAVIAFNFYEPLGDAFLYARQPAHADGIALISLFVLPLLVLRIVVDKFIGGNVVANQWVDRIGGGLIGIVTSLVIVGVLMTAIQMMPWKTSILGYVPYDDKLQRQSHLFPYPDEFTVGLVKLLSDGKFGSESSASIAPDPARPYAHIHDDLLLELYCFRNVGKGTGRPEPGKEEENMPLCGSLQTVPGGLTVLGVYQPADTPITPKWEIDVPRNPLIERGNTKVLLVRVELSDNSKAKDSDNMYRLVGTHFRMVGAGGRSYYPLGYLTGGAESQPGKPSTAGWKLHAPAEGGEGLPGRVVVQRPGDVYDKDRLGPNPRIVVDWVFRVPADEKPAYMVFRKVAKSPLPPVKEKEMPAAKEALLHKT